MEEDKKTIRITLFEQMRLFEIHRKYNIQKLRQSDRILSLLQDAMKIDENTTVETLKECQKRVRMMIDEEEKESRQIEKDKMFVKSIMDREGIKE